MMKFVSCKYKNLLNYILGISQNQLSQRITLPKFPYITAYLVFALLGSKVLGESVSIVLLVAIVLLDIKWWLLFIGKSAIVAHPLKWLFLIIIVGIGLSAFTSISAGNSWYRFFTTLAIAWVAIGTFEILSRLSYKIWLPILVKIFVVFTTIIILEQSIGKVNSEEPGKVTYLSWIVVCILPILIYSVKYNIDRWHALFIIFTILLSAFHLESRATLVSFFIIAITYLFLVQKTIKWRFSYIIIGIIILSLIYYFGFAPKYELFSEVKGELFVPQYIIDPVRQATWKFAWESIPNVPMFGYGIEASNKIPGADVVVPWLAIAPLFIQSGVMENLPHNIILQWLLELGWINFSLIIILYILLFIKLLYEKNEIRKYELMVHAGYFSISLINSNFWTSFWVIAYVFSIAILYALSESKKRF